MRLFTCALWSPAWKGLTSWLVYGVLLRVCYFPIGILGQVWYLIVSIPDLCTLTYYDFVLKKLNFDFMTPNPGSRGWGIGGV